MSKAQEQEYLDALQTFYSERLKAGLKKRFKKCQGCSHDKQFIVKQGKLYYTCGSSGQNCGLQFEIDLATHVHYPETVRDNIIMQSELDISKHSDIFTEKEIKDHQELVSITESMFKQAQKEFSKLNDLSKRQSLIQSTHKKRMNQKKEQNLLMKTIQQETDPLKKKGYMKEYILLNQTMREDYQEIHKECYFINNYLPMKPGKVVYHRDTTITEEETPIVEPEIETKEDWKLSVKEITYDELIETILSHLRSNRLIGIILRHFMENDTLSSEQFSQIKGNYKSIWADIIKSLQITGDKKRDSHNWLASCQYHLDSSIIEKADKNSKVITLTMPWREILDSIKKDYNQGKSLDKNLIPQLQGLTKQPMNKQIMNVIVAYRDPGDGSRETQLKQFTEQMKLIFKDQTDIRIYIVEQESDRDDYGALPELIKQPNSTMAKFNLGILKNIGFSIAKKAMKGKQNAYYILSDVDLLPSQGLVEDYLKYPKNPIHLANKGTRYNMDGNDRNFLGGVISITDKDFEKANGYPNNFWGWGGEDNALNYRLRKNNVRIEKPREPVIDLEELSLGDKLAKLKRDQTKEMRKREKLEEDKTTWKQNGLSDLEEHYTIKSRKKPQKNINHIKVELKID